MKYRYHLNCTILSLFFVMVLMAPLCYGSTNLPPSYFINLKKEKTTDSVIIWFSNGSYIQEKSLNLQFNAFSVNDREWRINFSVQTDRFLNSVSLTGIMANGQLVINSTPTVFKISPALLEQNRSVSFAQSKYVLDGKVTGLSLSPTGVGEKSIKNVMIQFFHIKDNGSETLPLVLGYDQKTGILVYAGMALSDVLLELVGIDYLVGTPFLLTSYSDNLSFDFVTQTQPFSLPRPLLIIILPVVLFGLVAVFYFNLTRNRRRHAKIGKTRSKRF